MKESIEDLRQKVKCKYKQNVKLQEFTYLQTGGVVDLILFPENSSEFASSLKYLNDSKIPFKIVGATSNLIFRDEVSYSCLLCTKKMSGIKYKPEESQIVVDCGAMLPNLSRFALQNSVTGFEGLEGIPGTVGGAVFMNAGAYGYEIKDILLAVDVVTLEGNNVTYSANDLNLRKRNSAFRTGKLKGIITRCYFNAEKRDADQISDEMELYHAKRHKYQDFLYPNLGSIFSGSVYRALGDRDFFFKVISALYYLFLYKWKIFTRESPLNRKWLNDFAVKRFGLEYEVQPFSNKTINCLVNRGQGTGEMIRFIEEIKELVDGKVPQENEIVEPF